MIFKTSCIISHLHYNYIFMHYTCVLYMLICCVLLGLDWVEPMIFFLVCMSHVHAFSCIRTLISLYSYILMYLVLFFVCVSLSLFLSLSCIMEPKRKSVSSQNSLRSGASTSSSDPTPSSVRFRDEKACKNFLENFSRRGIHLERQVILSEFADTDLRSVIHSRGWESLCDVPGHPSSYAYPGVLLQHARD